MVNYGTSCETGTTRLLVTSKVTQLMGGSQVHALTAQLPAPAPKRALRSPYMVIQDQGGREETLPSKEGVCGLREGLVEQSTETEPCEQPSGFRGAGLLSSSRQGGGFPAILVLRPGGGDVLLGLLANDLVWQVCPCPPRDPTNQ